LRNLLVGRGLSEAMPLPFLAPGDLERCGLPGDEIEIRQPAGGRVGVANLDVVEEVARHYGYTAIGLRPADTPRPGRCVIVSHEKPA
jgi:phenylalanyl-tRNA synthetase beta chain